MGLLNNLKEQAIKSASELVDKTQEKLSEIQLNNDSSTDRSVSNSKPSQKEQPNYQPQPQGQLFSKEMEALIQATLEDGVLEEYEKAALVKRAQAEGVDLAELEIYINSLLQKRQRELNQKKDELDAKYEKEKKEAFGRTCPNCGKQVPPLTLKCDCGYEFTTAKSVSSVQVLSDKIEHIMTDPKIKVFTGERYQRVKDTINLFPVPNTKEDIIEFLSLSAPNARKIGGIWGTKGGRALIGFIIISIIAIIITALLAPSLSEFASGLLIFWGGGLFFVYMPFCVICCTGTNSTFIHNDLASAWRSKFDQVLMKGRSLRGDAEFTQQLDYYEKMMKK